MLAKSAQLARRLRQEPTAAEAALWRAIRGHALEGLRFRRQHPIDRYVADFACLSLKLAIEVDGRVHRDDDQSLRDLGRTEVIASQGWQVLRFTNDEVLSNVDRVVAVILEAARTLRGG
jgi:very-short-patch-repair endonuclease